MDNKTLMEKTKRMRVKGTGPSRDDLVLFKKIGQISDQSIRDLNNLLDKFADRNDINGDNYQISNNVDCQGVFGHGQNYRQILMQGNTKSPEVSVNEYDYDTWLFDAEITKEISHYFENVYRFRMSEMTGRSTLNWHIDSCTSVMCRAQICLNENDAVFEFKDRDKNVHGFTMKPGELWFINTARLHRVVTGDMTRRVAIFGYHFDQMNETLKDMIRI